MSGRGELFKTRSSDIVVGIYAEEMSAAQAIDRLRGERFFRSALISVSDDGKQDISGHLYVLVSFAAILASISVFLSKILNHSWTSTLLLAAVILAVGVLTGRLIGLVLPRSLIREYSARVLPGENMVIVQCAHAYTRHVSGLLQVSEAEPAVFIIRPYLNEPWKPVRRERELFPAEQLRLHAAACAESHSPVPPSKPRKSILHYLDRWERILENVRRDLSEAVALGQSITPSAEWLLDNAYIIRNHLQDIRRNLPRRYYEILPRLDAEADDMNLRVLRLSVELANKTDGNITPAAIYNFLSAYQGSCSLNTAELWTFPLMVRYALIEDLAHQSLRVSRRQHDRERADFWANRLLSAAQRLPERIPAILADISSSMPILQPHFVIRLTGQVSEEETVFSAAQKWLEDKMGSPLAEILRAEHGRQTRKQLSIANDVTTLRRLTQLDWREMFESISIIEAILEQDSVYSASDFTTRDYCRRAVEEIARYSGASEMDVARGAIQLSSEASSDRSRSATYFLADKGRIILEQRFGCRLPVCQRATRWILDHAGLAYFVAFSAIGACTLGLGLILAARDGAGFWRLIGFAIAAVWPASEVSIQIVNHLAGLFIPPRFIPRMSFDAGIPGEFRTLVVVPTMLLTPDSVKDEVAKLEVRYLANPEPNLLFGLLTDFSDAPSQTMPEDRHLFEIALNGITELNARHGNGRFFLFHRDRSWCETERRWIGWERKRGKLEDLNRFLNEEPREGLGDFLRAGNRLQLKGVRFVITLDADTELPHLSALHLVEAMAHPLNQPVISPDRRIVCEGYGIIQPRVVTSLPSATASLFTSLFANSKGTDPYAQAISDVYQDLFGEGIYIGKAIYDVRTFHQVLSARFPEQTLLSHDLIEGNHLRTGFDSTILLFEQFPSNYESFSHRQHRWIRGDWQIMDWLLPRVPGRNGKRERNPLSWAGRWRIFDNLRRSLIPPACLAVLAGSWLVLPSAVFWNVFIAFALLVPALVPIPTRVREGARGRFFVWRDQGTELLRCAVNIALLPYQAWISLDAIARVLFRRAYSRRNLLQWETAQTIHWRYKNSPELQWRTFLISIGTVVLALILFHRAFSVWPAAMPYLALWLSSPAISWWINAPKRMKKGRELTMSERQYVKRLARETWRYFDDFVGPQSNWLPPDNSQEAIRIEVAYRTSPTNIGLWLLSVLAARDFGYLTNEQLEERLSACFETLNRLEKFQGHLLNWYDIKTLEPLLPRYVSTVDSGNLLASLWTLEQGLRGLIEEPIAGPECREGIADVLSILQSWCEKVSKVSGSTKTGFAALTQSCRTACPELKTVWEGIHNAAAEFERLSSDLRAAYPSPAKDPKAAGELAYWLNQGSRAFQNMSAMLDRYFSWVPLLLDPPPDVAQSVELSRLTREVVRGPAPSLRALAEGDGDAVSLLGRELGEIRDDHSGWVPKVRQEIAKARQSAMEMLDAIQSIIKKSGELQDGMRFGFLFDQDRKIFSIGHEISDSPQSPSYYDLLASEARLTSLVAIARGEVNPEHWQTLGRPFGIVAGRKVLFSWSGSMFEYLMPLIFTRTFESSLLHHACKEAVAAQIAYGRSRHVPWGISESAFSALDANQIYQYRAFGVPALGLKRGLGDDLVIAPYSTALALMVEPQQAVNNFKALERSGLHGNRGFYEAIDYSRESREGKQGAIVYAYMAHHQGMSFLAMNNALLDNRMQRRFHAYLRVRSIESLLYEGIPSSKIASFLSSGEERMPARLIAMPVETVSGRSSNEKTPVPKTHLLSNGSYSLMITNSGGGYSRWRDNDITRWRSDTTRDHWGAYCYIRDLDTSEFWATTYHPADRVDPGYSVTYHSDRVEFRNRFHGIESTAEVTVSPEEDVEVRRIVLVNRSGERRRVDLTTYAELVLAPHAADRAHPAFNKLFVETEILPEKSAILAFRHSSEEREPQIWAGQVFAAAPGLKAQYETSRAQFIGRGRSLNSPAAMTRDLSGTAGPVLDPILSIRKQVTLEPGEKIQFAAVTLAADTRENAMRLIDKYGDLEAADRVFEMAWTHSQLSFRYLRIQNEEAQHYQELAARLLYPHAGLRPGAERLRRNSQGQSRLWAFGISGDLPICVLVVGDPLDLGTVRETLQAHTFWNEQGLKSDLVILNNEAGSYDQPLQQKLIKLIQIHSVNTGVDRPGGVFLRSADQLSGEDLTLFLSVAHIVLLASRGSISRQLSSQPEAGAYPPPFKPAASIPEDAGSPQPMPSLNYFNGIGGFTSDGLEYVMYLEGDNATPAPWINVMANSRFGSLVDEAGQGVAWHLNSQLNRVTPWHNDPVASDSSSAIYVRDEDTGAFWCPAAAPVPEMEPYRIHHGQGYTRIEHNSHGIEHDLLVFVPVNDEGGDPLRIQRLELRNTVARKRRLTITFYAEWVLGRDREETQLHVASNWDPVSKALLARNAYNSEFSRLIAFAAARPAAASYSADRTELLGRNGSARNPAALRRRYLSGRTGAGLDPCAALQVRIELEPGQAAPVAFLLGQAETVQDIRSMLENYSDAGKIDESFAATTNWWNGILGAIQVHTPEQPANFLLNRWLLYQTLSCRIWGRSGLYQSGGAFGFRDQLQDVMAMIYAKPEIVREQILRAASRQFLEGDVQHWWHPQSGAGVRTRCSDDLLWLPYVVAHYVQVTGDAKILDERVPFLEGQPLKEKEMEVYSTPSVSMTDGTLMEHCRRAVEKGYTSGPHGLPLIGLCDWNDGFNRVGIEGRGESIWLAWFLIAALRGFRQLCIATDQNTMADICDARIARLGSMLELHAWDGEWYRRAYFDDGSPLGSINNQECRIDSLAQSWAVISGAAPEDRADKALHAVEEHLIQDDEKLILLFTPAFRKPNPGYVGAYPPGVRENGGQYTHAATWVALAFARQGNGKRAVELLRMLNPIELTRSPAGMSRYKCEPYVLAGDVYSLDGQVGRGGWTWYTGSSAWMYRVWIEEVLGFRLRGKTLAIDPVIPAQWPGFSITYAYGRSKYRINVENPQRTGRGIARVELDGALCTGGSVALEDDGREHSVRVQLGRKPGDAPAFPGSANTREVPLFEPRV